MELHVDCAMCGKNQVIRPVPLDRGEPNIRAVIEATGWRVEMNGQNFDIYCSRKCAE